MREFKLPDPGEGLTEATIIAWKVKEGDDVKVNDIILEVETSKSLVELPSPWKGKVAKILVPEGTEVEVGTPIVIIDDGSGSGGAGGGDAKQATAEPAGGESGEQAKPVATPKPDEVEAAQPAGGDAAGEGRAFKMPDPGEGLTEATIIAWKVTEGQQVKVNDIILEVETSKSLVELPTPWTGTITKILVPEGEEVAVGTPIVMIDDGSGAKAKPAADQGGKTDDDEGSAPNLVGYGVRQGSSKRRARKGGESTEQVGAAYRGQPEDRPSLDAGTETGEPPVPVADQAVAGDGKEEAADQPAGRQASGKVLAKPPVRKWAKDHGIDLAQVTPSGPGGVITRADVEGFAKGGHGRQAEPEEQRGAQPGAAAAPARPAAGDRREPIKGVRKVTAKAMVDSAFTKVHVTEWLDVDVSATMELVDRLRTRREFRDVKVSPMLIFAKAVCFALGRHESLNASWDEAAQEVVYHGDVNLGIAAATPRGLMVPNIKGAQAMSLAELNQAMAKLVSVAREGKLQPSDYAGGTFTISNVGVFGVDTGTPIINGNESAILALGSITRKPWVVGTGADERIEPRWVTTLGLSFDHRLIDGEQGSRFLRDLADLVADPALALLF